MKIDWYSSSSPHLPRSPPSSPLTDPMAPYELRSPHRPIILRLPAYDPTILLPSSTPSTPSTLRSGSYTPPSEPLVHRPGDYNFWLTPEPDTGTVRALCLPRDPSYFETEAIKLWTAAAMLPPGKKEDELCTRSFCFLVDVLHSVREMQPEGEMDWCGRCRKWRLISEGGFEGGDGRCGRCVAVRRNEAVRRRERRSLIRGGSVEKERRKVVKRRISAVGKEMGGDGSAVADTAGCNDRANVHALQGITEVSSEEE